MNSTKSPFSVRSATRKRFVDVHVRLSSEEAEALKKGGRPMAATLRDAAMHLAEKQDEEKYSTRLERLESQVSRLPKIEARIGDLYAQGKAIEADQIARETAFRESLAESMKALSKSETDIKTITLLCLSLVHGIEDQSVRRSLARAMTAHGRKDAVIQNAMLTEALERAK